MQPPDHRYWYGARVVSVYDGDTLYLDLDLGTGIHNRGQDGRGLSVRMHGIQAPELKGQTRAAGLESRDALLRLVTGLDDVSALAHDDRRVVVPDDRGLVTVNTIRDATGKYGRLLARVYVQQPDGRWCDVNARLIALGHAVVRDYA